jgi:hypothetical protein
MPTPTPRGRDGCMCGLKGPRRPRHRARAGAEGAVPDISRPRGFFRRPMRSRCIGPTTEGHLLRRNSAFNPCLAVNRCLVVDGERRVNGRVVRIRSAPSGTPLWAARHTSTRRPSDRSGTSGDHDCISVGSHASTLAVSPRIRPLPLKHN